MRHPRGRFVLLLVLAALLPTGAVRAQEEAQEESPDGAQEGFFFESVDVNLVNVEVFVTDKRGNPITGLKREDFEIQEDGRPLPIANFYAVEGGRPVEEVAPPEDADPAELLRFGKLPLIPEDQRLSLVVYIDNFNIRPFNRNRVFRRLREWLHDNLDVRDRVMLVTYDRELHVRHPFTSDAGLIATTLFDLEKLSGHAVHQDNERRDLVDDIDNAESIGEVAWRVRQQAESMANDLTFTIRALKELIGGLSGLEGRKALLYVSDGLQMSPAEDLYHLMQNKFGETSVMLEARDFHFGRRYRELTQLANTSRVVFYTIDAAGLRVSSSASVERARYSTGPGQDALIDSIYISNLQSPLRFMAEETGGLAIVNTNDVGPGLDRVAADFGSYYSLGYTPAHQGDGRYHSIKVKVNRKGLKVRHRDGYRDKNSYARMADRTTSSLMYGLHKNPMDLAVEVGVGQQGDRGRFMVPVLVKIPLASIVLVPQREFHEGRIKLFFSAMDEKGDMANVQEVPLEIRIPSSQVEAALGKPYQFKTELQMRPGGHRVAVGVRDEIGAAESFVTRDVLVGSG